jgi:hypothetical protein
MRIDPDAPGFLALLRGEGPLVGRILAWAGVVVLGPTLVLGTLIVWTPA